jgi:hypothetical protein
MALFRATVKVSRVVNGVRLEKGMSVDFPSRYTSPLSTNGGVEVIEAFQRKYGINLKKANAANSNYIDVVKLE